MATRRKKTVGSGSARKRAPTRKAKRKAASRKKSARKASAPKKAPKRSVRKKKATAVSGGRGAPARKSARAKRSARPFRLAPDVVPSSMEIHVDVDPSRSDEFRGEVAIDLELGRRRSSIELHAADLRVSRARVRRGDETLRGRVRLHRERESVEIEFDQALPAGALRLELRFAGRLRRDLCGLYGALAGDQHYAFTQLEAADARKFFPCFDEPAMKVRLRLSVTTGAANAVVSNMPVARVAAHEGGSKTVYFERSPRLSTYLAALAVGPLECTEPTLRSGTPIRVWHLPGKGDLCEFALEAARETLSRLEAYFDLPYPYPKLDLVAVPDFEFGAMENPGAVFFRETLLLTDPATVTLAEKKRAAEVICHELAHMWYGDLVTMKWWDDLWLNEAFATWMAFAIVDDWKPEWKMWQDFQHHRVAALDLDALTHTHPIYTTVRTPDEANENFDVITYEKGASVVRMLEHYLGRETFREGVRRYIRRHRESNTVAADLWSALAEASGEKVEALVRPWIELEGYPVVVLRRLRERGKRVLELRQERFLERPGAGRASRTGARQRWPVPWVGRVGSADGSKSVELRQLLTRSSERVALRGPARGFLYGNAQEGGFFRPHHDGDLMDDLLANLRVLSAVERLGLVDHQWALVRAGRAPLASLLDLCAALGNEADPDVLQGASRPLVSLTDRLARDTGARCGERLRAWVQVYYGAQVDALGFDVDPSDDEETRLRRAMVIDIVGGIGRATRVLREAADRCDRYLDDRRAIDPNLADVVVRLAATQGDASLHERFQIAMREARTPQEQRRFLLALADFEDPALVERTLELSLGDEVATQDVVFLFVRLFANPEAAEATWAFAKRRWPALRSRMPSLLAGRLIGATPALRSPAYRREVAAFFRKNPVPAAARALRQALERFDWYAEFRDRASVELAEYLAD